MSFNPALEIKSSELHKKLQLSNSPMLLDVRKSDQFNDWSIFDSKNIPLNKLKTMESLQGISKDELIVTICQKGNSSKIAAKHLQDLGYNVLSLNKGLTGWNSVLDTVDLNIENSDVSVTQIRRIAKGCLSYLISINGETAVIDPSHEIDSYLKIVDEQGLDIKHVLDTHLHADHVSGARLLAEKTGAKLHLSDKDSHNFEFNPINNNDTISLSGKSVITAISTPGHTEGSTTYKIRDLGLLTGDILFVDGIGRPDLADKASQFAKELYHSVTRKLLTLPKNMFVAPAHHGKFAQLHFNEPIITSIQEKQKSVNLGDEEEFIKNAVQSALSTTKPPSYEAIISINKGDFFLSDKKISELEAGPNRCAIQ